MWFISKLYKAVAQIVYINTIRVLMKEIPESLFRNVAEKSLHKLV